MPATANRRERAPSAPIKSASAPVSDVLGVRPQITVDVLRCCRRDHRREIIGIAILSPAAYLLVLWVLISTPVSYVAPVREISILIGTVAGIKLFSEGYGRRRIAGACCMLAGIIALVIG